MPTRARQPEPAWVALLGVLVLASGNFLWQLGTSSLYVDEVQSVSVAAQPLTHLLHALRITEITPPGYFLGLHEWITHVSNRGAEWSLRLPSALAALVLVAAVAWLAWEATGCRRAVLLAALLCALSPFVLEHGQRAQGYVFVSLASAVAVAAAVRAQREQRRPDWWLALSLLAALAALLTHYVAALAIAPLCLWLLRRPTIPRGRRVGYALVCLGAEVTLVPLLLSQRQAFPNRPGVAGSAAVSLTTAERVLAAPFDGRVGRLLWLGAAALVASLVGLGTTLVRRHRHRRGGSPDLHSSAQTLVITIAAGAPLALIVLSAIGGGAFWGHLMLSRYAAAAVPFMLVALAAAACLLPRLGLAAVAVAATVALSGSLASHRRSGFFFDARGIAAFVVRNHRRGDVVVVPSDPTAAVPLLHYGLGSLHPILTSSSADRPQLGPGRHRLWLVSELAAHAGSVPAILRGARVELRPAHPTALSVRVFQSVTPAVVILAALTGPSQSTGPG